MRRSRRERATTSPAGPADPAAPRRGLAGRQVERATSQSRSQSDDLYRRVLRAAVRRAALRDDDALQRLSGPLSDPSATSHMWTSAMYWSHRSPLLVADQLLEAVGASSLRVAPSMLERCGSLLAAGRRRNALLMGECGRVLAALGPGAMPLKGAWLLESRVYPSDARLFGDLDFAISPSVPRSEVMDAFDALGFERRRESTPDHIAFQRIVPDMRLYDGLPALREPIAGFADHYARIQRTFFAEAHYDIDTRRSLRRPFFFRADDRTDAARHLLLLSHHACKHEFGHAIGIVDIALLAASDRVDWGRLAALCQHFRATDICAAALGVVAECFGADLLPQGAAPFRSRRAFERGGSLGWAPALYARPSGAGRWLSVRLSRSLRATYGSALKALSPLVPTRFPLRVAHRRGAAAVARWRARGLGDA